MAGWGVTVHARALRRLGLVVMAMATLGGCVVTDYGSYTGSYYPGGYAYPRFWCLDYRGIRPGLAVSGLAGGMATGLDGTAGGGQYRSGWHGTRGNWRGGGGGRHPGRQGWHR